MSPTPRMLHKLLVVEDDLDLRESLTALLARRYDVVSAEDGVQGLVMALEERPHAIILDAVMPRCDGFKMVSELRKESQTRHIPVLMLTALSDLKNRLKAFELGVDDFLAKPFDPEELLVRIAAKLRDAELPVLPRPMEERSRPQKSPGHIDCGNLLLDTRSRSAAVNGRTVKLSLLEFNLLRYLVKHRNVLRTRKQILFAVWKNPNVSERLLDPHMMVIRRKLAGFDHEIASVYGGGYILRPKS